MNIQAMMKQAQKLQKDMMNAKKEIDETEFESSKSFVTIKATGNKKITSVKIDVQSVEQEEIEMIEDLILVTVNELMNKIDAETEKKLVNILKTILETSEISIEDDIFELGADSLSIIKLIAEVSSVFNVNMLFSILVIRAL